MEAIKLHTQATYKWGQTNILPGVGEILISEDGFIEVTSFETAQEIVECIEDFFIVAQTTDEETGFGLAALVATNPILETEDLEEAEGAKSPIEVDDIIDEPVVDESTDIVSDSAAAIIANKKLAAKNLIASKK